MRDTIKVGDAEIGRVEEIVYKMPLGQIVDDPALIAANMDWLAPRFIDGDGNWDMVWQSWVVRVDGKTVVIDPCNGNGRTNTAFPLAHMLDTPYIERFAATGVSPEDVDLVFCTHLHCDHCGWNTRLRAGRYVPTFPNARYVFVRREFDRWDTRRPDHQAVGANAGVFENSVLPVLEAGLAELVADTHRLTPSIAVAPAYGHTLGHSFAHLVSKDAEACFVGDAFHHPLELIRPEMDAHVDEDTPAAQATRRRLVDLCVARNALLVPAHFPAPHVGWVRRDGDGIRFEPLLQTGADRP